MIDNIGICKAKPTLNIVQAFFEWNTTGNIKSGHLNNNKKKKGLNSQLLKQNREGLHKNFITNLPPNGDNSN